LFKKGPIGPFFYAKNICTLLEITRLYLSPCGRGKGALARAGEGSDLST